MPECRGRECSRRARHRCCGRTSARVERPFIGLRSTPASAACNNANVMKRCGSAPAFLAAARRAGRLGRRRRATAGAGVRAAERRRRRTSPSTSCAAGRLRRLLGLVVRPVQALVSVDERDDAEVRAAGASTIVAINVDKKREDAEKFLEVAPGRVHRRLRSRRHDAGRMAGQGDAELVPRRRDAARSCSSRAASRTSARPRSRSGSAQRSACVEDEHGKRFAVSSRWR